MSQKPESSSRKWFTVEEVNAEIDELMRTDPVYRAKMEAFEAERQRLISAFEEAERPIVEDLREAGFEVTSIQDLLDVRDSEPYPDALPVLIRHLERGDYPGDVMEALGAAAAIPQAVAYWGVLERLYKSAQDEETQDGLALALRACATRQQFDRLVALVGDPSCGESRIFLLGTVKRLGKERGLDVLRSLLDDPVLGREARALVGRNAARDPSS
jgi:hypothetical protein